MFNDEDVLKVRELMAEPKRIRNVGLYDKKAEECFALSDLLIREEESDCDFGLRARCVKRRFNLKSGIKRYHGEEYLFNLIDAPRISYSRRFLHSLHLVDGMVVSVYSSEMLEGILRPVLSQNIKPILFINDIDDLSYGLNYDAVATRQKMDEIVSRFNELVKIHAPADKKEEWQIDITNVIFGSIELGFALDFQTMKKSGIEFGEMIEALHNDWRNFTSKFPLYRVLTRAIIEHLPSPDAAGPYRIPRLWNVAEESFEAHAVANSGSDDALTSWMIYNDVSEKYYCRVISGTLNSGHEACLEDSGINVSVELEETFGEVPAGSLVEVNLSGYDFEGCSNDVFLLSGNRISRLETMYLDPESSLFAGFMPVGHASELVCSMSVRTRSDDLINLLEKLNSDKKNPIFKVKSNEDGSLLVKSVSAVELYELIGFIKKYFSSRTDISNHSAIYRKGVSDKSGPVKVESKNERNVFSIEVEPLDGDCDELDRVWYVKNNNVFLNMTDDVPFLDGVKPALLEAFVQTVKEDLTGLKVKLVDARIHEDKIYWGPAHVTDPVTKAINDAVTLANPCLMEPVQKFLIFAPIDCLDAYIQKISDGRGSIVRHESLGNFCEIEVIAPVSTILGLLGDTDSTAECPLRAYDDKAVEFKAASGDR